MNPNDAYAQVALIRSLQLQRVATWMLEQVLADLKEMERDIGRAILQYNPSAGLTANTRREREQRLFRQIIELIDAVFAELRRRLEEQFDDVAAIQEKDERKWMLLYIGAQTAATGTAGAATLIAGATLAAWLGKQQADLIFRLRGTVTQGLASEQTAEELNRKIAGRSPGGGAPAEPSIATRTAAAIEATIRTGLASVAENVARATASTATNIRYGWQQISILDSRTTEICRAYAYKIWTHTFQPVAHALPFAGGVPRHVNCRSRIVMILLDAEPLSQLTFRKWMDRIPPDEQDRIFGEQRMKLWREGKIGDAELIRQQERALSIDGLRTAE